MTVVVDASLVVAALVDSGDEGSWAESVLAEALDRPLATLDRKLGRASGPKCEILVPPRPEFA